VAYARIPYDGSVIRYGTALGNLSSLTYSKDFASRLHTHGSLRTALR
jgi:hypothetical protein